MRLGIRISSQASVDIGGNKYYSYILKVSFKLKTVEFTHYKWNTISTQSTTMPLIKCAKPSMRHFTVLKSLLIAMTKRFHFFNSGKFPLLADLDTKHTNVHLFICITSWFKCPLFHQKQVPVYL